MKTIICDGFADGWIQLLHHLQDCETTSPRGLPVREEDCVAFRLRDLRRNILYHPFRQLNYRFMVAEWVWIARGWNSLSEIARFNKNMEAFSDDGKTLAGAYGPRLAPQWDWIIAKLKEKDTRQAVATIWTPAPEPSKDIPCTISLQWLAREGRLNCIVTMRSSDVWLGLPYDMFTFSQLTNSLAGELGLDTGWIQFNLGSSHMYVSDEEKALAITQDGKYYITPQSPRLPGMLPPTNKAILLDPWLTYAIIVNGTKTSVEALEVLKKLCDQP